MNRGNMGKIDRADDIKSLVLQALIDSKNEYISGQELSESLGVTRSAIWKIIGKLREIGYNINSVSNRGYRLEKGQMVYSAPLIADSITSAYKNKIVFLDTVNSTNIYASQLVLEGCPNGTVVVSNEQTQGAGRQGRSFASPKGCGIYMSLVVEPKCTMEQLSLLTSYAGLAVCCAIEELCGKAPSIKWPNDIIFDQKKVCGVLTRAITDAEDNSVTHAVVGIGINVLQDEFPEELSKKAVSLYKVTGEKYSRTKLVAGIIDKLNFMLIENNWLASPPSDIIERLTSRSCIIGKEVVIEHRGKSEIGTAMVLTNSGGLLVDFGQEVREIAFGEVSVRGLLGYI